MTFEDKLLNEYEDFCKFRCEYSSCKFANATVQLNDDNWESCTACGAEGYVNAEIEIDTCEYCKVKDFIIEIRDMKLEDIDD